MRSPNRMKSVAVPPHRYGVYGVDLSRYVWNICCTLAAAPRWSRSIADAWKKTGCERARLSVYNLPFHTLETPSRTRASMHAALARSKLQVGALAEGTTEVRRCYPLELSRITLLPCSLYLSIDSPRRQIAHHIQHAGVPVNSTGGFAVQARGLAPVRAGICFSTAVRAHNGIDTQAWCGFQSVVFLQP
jgi:hypothetical protein